MSGNRKTCTEFKINRSSLVRVAYSKLFDFGLGDPYRTAVPCNRSAYTKCKCVYGPYRLISILRFNLVLTYRIPTEFRRGASLFI